MHRYERAVLVALKGKKGMELEELAAAAHIGRDEAMWALENLKGRGFVDVSYSASENLELGDEGKEYERDGLPEVRLLEKASMGKTAVSSLVGREKIGLQWAKRNGWITIEAGMIRLTARGLEAEKKRPGINELGRDEIVKRGLGTVSEKRHITGISATKAGIDALGSKDGDDGAIDAVDRGMISSGLWKGMKFKPYDIAAPVEPRAVAMSHPLRRLVEEVKDAYASSGFREVSGPAVESSFWAFDSLFVPQDHPARDAQDTFYASNVGSVQVGDLPYISTVKKAHQRGWHSKWSEDIAGQMLLRVHTTSVSARYIYNIVHELKSNPGKYELPIKLFSVGRVFRNEALDYRHLADFYQHDGVIIGRNLTLSNLFDTLTKLYQGLGIKVRFKP